MVLRRTKQREIIRTIMSEAGRPLASDEILELARVHHPSLGIATVYRALKSLVEEKWLVSVELAGKCTHYELSGLEHHHHFYCQECDTVYDVAGCPGQLERLLPKGFTLNEHDLVLYGNCAKCS